MKPKTPTLALTLGGLIAVAAFAQNPPGSPPPRTGDPAGLDAAPRERQADVMGRVATVSPDGRSVTLDTPPRPGPDGQPPARDARGERVTVNLTDRTVVSFFGVGEGEARPAPGLMAMVWLDEGSRDQAA